MSTGLITSGLISPFVADPVRLVEGLQGTLVEIEALVQQGVKPVSKAPTLSSFVVGETKTLLLSVVTADGPFDLTGSTVFFTVKRTLDDKYALISKTSADPSEITILPQAAPDVGKAQIFISAEDTQQLDCLHEVVVDAWVVTSMSETKRVVTTLVVDVEQPVTTTFP